MELVQNKQKHKKGKEKINRERELTKGDFGFLNVSYFHSRI